MRIALAEHYLYQGRMEDSEKELNAVIKEMNSQKARKVLAEIKLETGKPDEAKPLVDAILKENDKDLDGKYLKGRIALAEKRLDDAKALFAEVVKQDAAMARARLYNGLTEIQQGQIDVGRKEIQEAVKLDPNNVRARLLLGEVYLRSQPGRGGEGGARGAATEPVQRAGGRPLRRFLPGAEGVEEGRADLPGDDQAAAEEPGRLLQDGAVAEVPGEACRGGGILLPGGRAQSEGPDGGQRIHLRAGGGEADGEGEEGAGRVRREGAEEPAAVGNGGTVPPGVREAGGGGGGVPESIELAPEFTEPYYQLGVLYISQKKLPEAEAKLAKVIEKNDKNVGAHVLLGIVLNSVGKIDEANKEYRQVLTLSPKNPLAANNLASNLADGGGNLDEALKFAQIAREAAPEDPNVADTLGWIYYKKGLIDTAYPLISDAARKAKNNAIIRYHHGMVLSKKGKTKEAAAELKAALALDPNFPGAAEAKKTLATLKL